MTAKVTASVEQMLAWADRQPKPVRCQHCGKPLTHGISKRQGIGPVCRAQLNAKAEGA